MNYIDQGSALSRKVPNRKLSKKNSLFYQQSVLENEEFSQKYEKNVDQLQTVIEEPELKEVIQNRNDKFFTVLEQIIKVESSIKEFAKGYEKYGFIVSDNGITYREWAPNAKELKLNEYSCTTDNGGNWEVFIPKDDDDNHQISHGSPLITYCNGQQRASVWSTVVKGDSPVLWNPENKYEFNQVQQKQASKGLKLIRQQAHQIKQVAGYNGVLIVNQQLMALNSELVTPDELKKQIDNLHGQGIQVFVDIDHKELGRYLNNWDGSGYQYVREGTELIDFGKWEVLRILLSNIQYWLNEYKVDGFKFTNIDITDDIEAAVYLMLANDLLHDISPSGVSIICDIEYPALCRTIKEGGLGFDYRVVKLQHKQYLPKTLIETQVANQVQLLNALAIGQGIISDSANQLVQIEQQLGWLDNEFGVVEEVDLVILIRRGQYVFLLNNTNENKTINLKQSVKQVHNKEGAVKGQVDENTVSIEIESQYGLIVE